MKFHITFSLFICIVFEIIEMTLYDIHVFFIRNKSIRNMKLKLDRQAEFQ